MKRRKLSARRRVRTGTALFLCMGAFAGLLLWHLLTTRVPAVAQLFPALGTLVCFALPALLGLCVIDGNQTRLLPARALSPGQALWLALTGVLAVCPITLLADVLGALAGRFTLPLAAAMAGAVPVTVLKQLVYSALIVPLCEELFFRGYVQGALACYGEKRVAAFVALAFALAHGVSINLPGFFLLGLLLCALTLRTGSLLASLLVHGLYNATLVLLSCSGLGALFDGLTPLSCLLRLLGCGAFAYAMRRAFAAKGAPPSQESALRLGQRELLLLAAALLSIVAAQLAIELLGVLL